MTSAEQIDIPEKLRQKAFLKKNILDSLESKDANALAKSLNEVCLYLVDHAIYPHPYTEAVLNKILTDFLAGKRSLDEEIYFDGESRIIFDKKGKKLYISNVSSQTVKLRWLQAEQAFDYVFGKSENDEKSIISQDRAKIGETVKPNF